MTNSNALNQDHPFQFKIEDPNGFKQYILSLISEDLLDKALIELLKIKEKYVQARELREIPTKSFAYDHFQKYWKEQLELAMKKETYPDGSRDKVIFEINQLEKKLLQGKKK